MNAAAVAVVETLPDIAIAYGISDEYSFVFHKHSMLFERREAKLISTVVSTFTAAYIWKWDDFFPEIELEGTTFGGLPTFDARAVCYPADGNLRDYMSWRQVDAHINNLYNTTFWALVSRGAGMSNTDAEELLKGTVAADKNEILFSRFSINYNNEPAIFRKGSVVFREYALEEDSTRKKKLVDLDAKIESEDEVKTTEILDPVSRTQAEKMKKAKKKAKVVVEHLDIIKDDFWNRRPWILSGRPGRPVMEKKDDARLSTEF